MNKFFGAWHFDSFCSFCFHLLPFASISHLLPLFSLIIFPKFDYEHEFKMNKINENECIFHQGSFSRTFVNSWFFQIFFFDNLTQNCILIPNMQSFSNYLYILIDMGLKSICRTYIHPYWRMNHPFLMVNLNLLASVPSF